MNYLVTAELKRGGFSPCWYLSQEQLFLFFGENVHEQVKQGIKSRDSFFVTTETERYLIAEPLLPFYMNLKD